MKLISKETLAKISKSLLLLFLSISCWNILELRGSNKAAGAFADPILTGKERKIEVKPTNENYYLATLVQESQFYDPTFYDDFLLTLDGKRILHFTKVQGVITDFYYYVTDSEDLNFLRNFFREHRSEIDAVSDKIYSSLLTYRGILPIYAQKDLNKKVAEIVKDITKTTLQRVVGESPHLDKIDAALFQYLCSNGIQDLSEIKKSPSLVNMLVNKFYMLPTTYFYRDFGYIRAFLKYLPPLKVQADAKNVPLKFKVFACSSGEEVLTYAIELLEAGIQNFTILGSDINDASLRYADEMKYSYTSFERLPIKIKEKLQKYFRLNPLGNLWELKDPDFFKKRIQYRHQDILENLPNTLDPAFAPPYDLVSILNVLLYLENDAIQKRKDAWTNLLNPEGILVLHDAQYTLAKGVLDHRWCFDNYFIVNEWVNVKTGKDWTLEKKVAAYEKDLDLNSEMALTLLYRAYVFTEQHPKAIKLCETYLKKHPLSFPVLSCALDEYQWSKNETQASITLRTLVESHIQQSTILNKLIASEKNKEEIVFLNKLKEQLQLFLTYYRSGTKEIEKAFDFDKAAGAEQPTSQKYEPIRMIFKTMAYSMLQQSCLLEKNSEKIEKFTLKGIEMAEKLYQTYPEYIIAGKFLNSLLEELVEFYMNENNLDKAFQYCEQGLEMFEKGFRNKNYFYVLDGLARLNLKKAIIWDQRGNWDKVNTSIGDAIFFYEQALSLLQDLPLNRYSHFYASLGQCYLIRARFSLQQRKKGRAESDLAKSFTYLERSLEMNPLYGKEAYQHRTELLKLLEQHKIPLENISQKG